MATIKNPTIVISGGGGVGDIANGIIKQYKASTGTISANTFVEFVNNDTSGTATQISTNAASPYAIAAAEVDTNKVMLVYTYNSYIYGVVCTIAGATITVGTVKQIAASSGSFPSVVRLGVDRMFIAFAQSSNLHGIVCSISGTTITTGTDKTIDSTTNSGKVASVTLVSGNRILIAYSVVSSSNAYIYGVVCTIPSTTITAGTPVQLTTGANSADASSASIATAKLDDMKAIVAHRSGSSSGSTVNAFVCNISGRTITIGSDTQIAPYLPSGDISMVQVDTDKVFVAFASTVAKTLFGLICTVADTAITASECVSLYNDIAARMDYPSCVALDTATVVVSFVCRNNAANGGLFNVKVNIDGTSVVKDCPGTVVSATYTAPGAQKIVSLDVNSVLCLYLTTSRYPSAIVRTLGDDTIKMSESRVDGLTKTQCTSSTPGQVWKLKNEM